MIRRSLLLSLIEQGLASLGTLAMSAAVIRTSNPEVFGHFSFAFTLVLVAASLQYGLVGTSLLVELRPLEAEKRVQSLEILLAFDFYFRVVAAVAVAGVCYTASHDGWLTIGAGFFAGIYLWREASRNALFALDEALLATRLQAISFVLLIILLAVTLSSFQDAALAAFLAYAVSNAVALALCARSNWVLPGPPLEVLRAYRSRFPFTGWILARSAANEVQMRSHVILLQMLRGIDQVGVVEAARVLFAPVQLISGAWQRAVQPQLSALLHRGDGEGARRLVLVGVAGMAGISIAYSAVLYLFYGLISAHLFGERYGDVSPYVIGWGVFTTLLLMNWTITGFLNALHEFRLVAGIGAVAALATLLLLFLLAFDVPLITALGVPIFVQACAFLVVLVRVLRHPIAWGAGGGRE